MKTLVVIGARGGSKGIPGKNIKPLCGKPLIAYTLEVARQFAPDQDICVSTDDEKIAAVVRSLGLELPFMRPAELATDQAGSSEVVLHAYEYYESIGQKYDAILLLQPTSPFRKVEFLRDAVALYDDSIDMVTSVCPAACNPYYDGFEEDGEGLLTISKGDGCIQRRQDAPAVWQQNGSIYVINPRSLKEKGMAGFTRIRGYRMPAQYSLDLDTLFDWKVAEMMISEKLI